jgi:hypothetical protein
MSSPATFDVESYFNEFADASAMAEAARIRTVPTGSYQLQVTKREGRYFELKTGDYGAFWSAVFTDEGTPVNPDWRKGVRLYASVINSEGKKLRSVNIDASWEAKRDAKTGEFDKLFRRWEQLTRALFPNLKPEERSAKSTGEVLNAASQYPMGAYITESYQTVAIDGTKRWVTAKTDEEAKTFREAGYKADNFVVSINKA